MELALTNLVLLASNKLVLVLLLLRSTSLLDRFGIGAPGRLGLLLMAGLGSGGLLYGIGAPGSRRRLRSVATLSVFGAIIAVASTELEGGVATGLLVDADRGATLDGVAERVERLCGVLCHLIF